MENINRAVFLDRAYLSIEMARRSAEALRIIFSGLYSLAKELKLREQQGDS